MAITVDRWHQALSLRGPQRAPQAARERAEALARGAGAALAAALHERLARRAGEVIRIRRLDVALTLDLALATDEARDGYAAALARAIAAALDDGGADVVRFADRTAYVTAFAVALAAGDAHQRWVFDEFDGLAPLPPGAALRTLVEETPDSAWALLARLARAPAVFAMLAGMDAVRVLDVLIATSSATAVAEAPALPPPSVLACPAAAVLERLARAAAAGRPTDQALVAAVMAASLAHRGQGAYAASATPPAVVAALEQRLRSLAPARHAEAVADGARPRPLHADDEGPRIDDETPCAAAGLVVLLDELDAWIAADFAARGPFALAALAAAAAPGDAARVWGDPVWRALLGVDARMDIDGFGALLAALDPEPIAASAAAVAANASRGAARCWRDAQRRTRGVDAATGLWLAAPPAPATVARACWRRARADEAALDHPLLRGLPPPWPELVAAAAQFTWRRVAWRVPGLRDASLPWLRRNLLGGDGSARREDDALWHWRCPRAPLHVLLAMTSLGAEDRLWRGPPERRLRLEFHG